MTNSNRLVTEENYQHIRDYLDGQIEQFLINKENWVLIRFKRLPESPDTEAITALNQWIRTHLSKSLVRDLRKKFVAPKMHTTL